MIKTIGTVSFLLFFTASLPAQETKPVAGMKISKNTTFKKGLYRIDAPAGPGHALIIIEGNNLVIDFNGVLLNGSNGNQLPDQFMGLAILVQNSKNVTIKNLRAKGYKIALKAVHVEKLTLEYCDFSYNYRPQLNSTQEKEDLSDWMSYHHNEKDEWLRYGAAVYLRHCDSAFIENCKVTGGQNALMMMECNDGLVRRNDFSYNSGIGIGMYRCSRNTISFNRVIFNVRGYSHGVYKRGQDSAGILVYEQSSDNSFYYNNVTHSGDGFFLWAGQTTMDTGQGGCNNNIIYGNDFSYAPTNGIEVTFSSNSIINNRIFECDHGIWGGYSYNTTIEKNQFRDNRIAIAIEHGQHNAIRNNLFSGDGEGIRLWSNKQQPAGWGYATYRDTRSAAYIISLNSFNNNPLAFNLARTDSLWIHDNTYNGNMVNYFKIDSTVTRLDSVYNEFIAGSALEPVEMAYDGKFPFEGTGKLKGRGNIRMTAWGPYDFRYPLIWNTNPTDTTGVMKFDILGPAGKWRIKKVKGVEAISARNGIFPSEITVKKNEADRTDISIELEYTGSAITTVFGETIPANRPYRFFFRKFFQPVDWEVKWYAFDSTNNPLDQPGKPEEMKHYVQPFKSEKTRQLDYAWWGGLKVAGTAYPKFLTIATGEADIPAGNYEISVTWDDAVRVWIDDQLRIDEWTPSRYTFDESPHKKATVKLGGKHRFRVEHVELGGFATLSLKIKSID